MTTITGDTFYFLKRVPEWNGWIVAVNNSYDFLFMTDEFYQDNDFQIGNVLKLSSGVNQINLPNIPNDSNYDLSMKLNQRHIYRSITLDKYVDKYGNIIRCAYDEVGEQWMVQE